MVRNSFIDPNTKRYDLKAEGEWIEVIDILNNGQQRLQDQLALKYVQIGEKVVSVVDWSMYEILRAQLWLVNWHIHDKDGKVPELSLDALKALNPAVFKEIDDIIFAHALESVIRGKVLANPSEPISTQISQ